MRTQLKRSLWENCFHAYTNTDTAVGILFFRFLFADIAEFFRTCDRTVDFNLPNWFSEFEDDLLKFRSEVNIPPTLSPPVKSDIDDEHSFEQQYDSSVIVTPPMSPVFVDFFRVNFPMLSYVTASKLF